MNPWITLVIGLIIGWILELLIDVFYWRKRRLCPDDDVLRIQAELEKAQTENKRLAIELNGRKSQIGELEAQLENWRGELSGLNEASKGYGFGSIFPNGQLKLGDFLAGLKERFAQFRADLAGKDAEISGLNVTINEKDVALGQVNAELGRVKAELQELDQESNRLGLGSLFAGSGLALSGFLGNLRDRFDRDDDDRETAVNLEAQLGDLRADLDARDAQIGKLEADLELCNSAVAELRSRDAEYMGPRGLSMVWGLNSDANDALEAKGIYTYNQLGATTPDEVDDALTYAQPYYPDYDNPQIHGSWVEQSRFAAGGDWEGLFGYQQSSFNVKSLQEDLKKMWGIGSKIEELLNNHGIYLYSQLASVPADRITEILREAGRQFQMSSEKLHESWPKQARLADQGKWDELKALTDTLSWSNVN